MKIYEALKEMIENKKIIVNKKSNKLSPYDYIYKRIITDDGINIILCKWEAKGRWDVSSLYLDPKDLDSEEWEIYTNKKGEK